MTTVTQTFDKEGNNKSETQTTNSLDKDNTTKENHNFIV